jgi:hypothetical protein
MADTKHMWVPVKIHNEFFCIKTKENFERQFSDRIADNIQDEETAELICKAVNNHARLIEMLKKVMREKYEQSTGETEIDNEAESLLKELE